MWLNLKQQLKKIINKANYLYYCYLVSKPVGEVAFHNGTTKIMFTNEIVAESKSTIEEIINNCGMDKASSNK